jgi:hypothetical protein
MSQARDLLASAGESGIALLNGLSACSIRSLMGAFSASVGRCHPKDRNRAPSTEEGITTAAPKEKTTTATVMNTTIVSANAMCLNLYCDDSANYKITDGLQSHAYHHQNVTQRLGKQRTDEARIHQKHYHHD